MNDMYSNIPELSAEQESIRRRRKIAEAIQAQSMQPLESQTAGGYVVPTSPLLGVGKLVEAYLGRKGMDEADAQQSALGEKAMGMQTTERQKIVDAITQKDEKQFTPDMMPGEDSPFGKLVESSAKNKTPEEQLGSLIQAGGDARFPANQKWSDTQQKYLEAKEELKARALERADAAKIQRDFLEGMQGSRITSAESIAANKAGSAEKISGDKLAADAKSGAKASEYEKTIQKTLGKSNMEAVASAGKAADTLSNVKMVRDALDAGAITGSGASTLLAVEKAMASAGLVGEGKAANTQALISGLSQITLSGIKTSGLGTGQGFTDKDLVFLNEAISGSISSTPENIRRVADLSEKYARASHARGTQLKATWMANPNMSMYAQDINIPDLPESLGVNRRSTDNAKPISAAQHGETRTLPDGRVMVKTPTGWIQQ